MSLSGEDINNSVCEGWGYFLISGTLAPLAIFLNLNLISLFNPPPKKNLLSIFKVDFLLNRKLYYCVKNFLLFNLESRGSKFEQNVTILRVLNRIESYSFEGQNSIKIS